VSPVKSIPYLRGRWIGRKDAIVAASRGVLPPQAEHALDKRAAELSGATLDGYWRGVADIRPGWSRSSSGDRQQT
jgi:hypothetical protein